MMKNIVFTAALVLAFIWAEAANSQPQGTRVPPPKQIVSFAVVGDTPYGDANVPLFDNVIADINVDKDVRFVMHAGDIKSGGSECSDERIVARYKQYQQFHRPFIYTPGDNEWTDCHRPAAGGYHPLERLAFLRETFFPTPSLSSGEYKMRVTTQAGERGFEEFVENVMFHRAGVVFATVHVVGSNNNLSPWSGIDPKDTFDKPRADRLQEFQAREAASLAWLDRTFTEAKRQRARGVFILMQANPLTAVDYTDPERAGFNAFLARLYQLTEQFDGQVMLAHGDSHVFFLDKPKLVPWYADGDALTADDVQTFLPNLTRFQTFGDSTLHWLKVTVDQSRDQLFLVEPMVVEENL